MASLETLKLPVSADDDKENLRWDEQFTRNEWKRSSIQQGSPLCSHAVARSSIVYGIGGERSDDKWTTWQTSFAPYHVCRVASNHNGSIVVASTDGGTIALMRGRDGKVLATRRVSTLEGLQRPAEISFVSNRQRAPLDSLMILVSSDLEENPKTNIILVSAIDGDRLNSEHPGNVAEGARTMAIDALKLQGSSDFDAIQGCFLDSNTIRFAAGSGNGKVSIHDYSLDTKIPKMIKESIEVDNSDDTYQFDTTIGIGVQHSGISTSFFLLCGRSSTKSHAVWYNISHLTIACSALITSDTRDATMVIAMEPVKSCYQDSAVAVAVAIKSSKHGVSIHVLQAAVEDTLGMTFFSRPHLLYDIPMGIGEGLKSIGISAKAGEGAGPYSFRVWIQTVDTKEVYNEFSCKNPAVDGLVGKIRLLLQNNLFDEADKLIDIYQGPWDEYARFHPSEVVLRKLDHVFSTSTISESTMATASNCLKCLANGALSGENFSIDNLLEAADIIMDWPSKTEKPPKLLEFIMALHTTASTFETIFEARCSKKIEEKKIGLERCLSAMNCIHDLLRDGEATLDKPFASVRSNADLFQAFISQSLFSSAEKMWRSNQGKELSPEVLVSAMLTISSSVDPRTFATLLKEVIITSLSVNHEALPLISVWTCQTAEEYDDGTNPHGINAAIYLLETVLSATNQLGVKLFSSFSSFSPFASDRTTDLRRGRYSPRNFATDSSETLHTRPSATSAIRNERPMPTVLELGRLKGGAIVSLLPSIRSSRRSDDENDDEVDPTVAVKLVHAKQLKEARELGLSREEVCLRSYAYYGGASQMAKELVRIFSSRAEEHETRLSSLTQFVKSFCVNSNISYDDAIFSYASGRCNHNMASEAAITEASSLSRCCESTASKCKVALSVLRAALLCGKLSPCLSQLSKDAIDWAGGENALRSEVVEASRLLVIDSIVQRYCGVSAAHELFRVDNPQHAKNLLDFVCRHISFESVLQDAIDLCDAFTYLSKSEASILILERAAVSGNAPRCQALAEEMFRIDLNLAALACDRALAISCATLEDLARTVLSKFASTSKAAKQSSIATCSAALTICELVLSHENHRNRRTPHFGNHRQDWYNLFTRVSQLQKQHNIFVSPQCLLSAKSRFTLAKKKIESLFKSSGREDFSSASFTEGKRICSLFVGPAKSDASRLWLCILGGITLKLSCRHNYDSILKFLRLGGLLDGEGGKYSNFVMVAVVMSLCQNFSVERWNESGDQRDVEELMKAIIVTASVLQGSPMVYCPEQMLDTISSLLILTTTASQILKRSDGGVGERLEVFEDSLFSANNSVQAKWSAQRSRPLPSSPKLHPSWYIGDGLLLPPGGALDACVLYCKESLELISSATKSTYTKVAASGVSDLNRLFSERGAHSSALGISSRYLVLATCATDDFGFGSLWQYIDYKQETMRHLTERSLGGSGNGITSVSIDSELAVPYILALPIKLAFKIYSASLPTAITQCDFARVITLANVGIQGGCKGIALSGWKKQTIFIKQCHHLSSKATWWRVLRKFEVDFDPRKFDYVDHKSETETDSLHTESTYIASLLPGIVRNATNRLRNVDLARDLALNFANSFGLGAHVAAQKHIEFLLSCPPNEAQSSRSVLISESLVDLRRDLSLCDRAVQDSLKLIGSAMKRAAILRRCLVTLEQTEDCDTDYERHSLILSLYHADLVVVVAQDPTIRNLDAAPFEEELEVVERRRDALSILMSFFHGKYDTCRPRYPKLFSDLPVPFKMERTTDNRQRCGVLGNINDVDSDLFDPLSPLIPFLSQNSDTSTCTAIAPLCIPLGLPQGYIHVRGLVARFSSARMSKCTAPNFENDVLPVLCKLKSPNDKAILAEYCAMQYKDEDSQKLVCLDKAIECAMQASSELEARLRRYPCDNLHIEEQKALATVKRLTTCKSMLSDKCHVLEILRSNKIDSYQFRTVKSMIDDLTLQLNDHFWSSNDTSPDRFVELLLSESSILAAEACLDEHNSFSIGHFRYLASVVHKTCREISEQYSHIHAGQIARTLSRRWLVHGDMLSKTAEISRSSLSESPRTTCKEWKSSLLEDDDTVNFVLDLNVMTNNSNCWTAENASREKTQREHQVNREEEPSGLAVGGSDRELSERATSRASLRIAFVMSFAEEYHSKSNHIWVLEDQENSGNTSNLRPVEPHQRKTRGGLLSRIAVHGSKQDCVVIDHAKELLSVVFAKSGGTCEGTIDVSVSVPSANKDGDSDARKTVTFAMRHRALRTAAILCPQDALEKVIRDEGYLTPSTPDACSLRECCFGSFVAKEIEEMGLPLPHSDLAMLSAMDFHSFARTLWRHHRNGYSKGAKGRLLSLLLEMSTRESRKVDSDFVACILDDMARLKLPRTILNGCQNLVERSHRSLESMPLVSILSALAISVKMITSEFREGLLVNDLTVFHGGLPTLQRLGRIAEKIADIDDGQIHICQFCHVLADLFSICPLGEPASVVATVILGAVLQIKDNETRRLLLLKISSREDGKMTLRQRFPVLVDKRTDCILAGSISAGFEGLETASAYMP